MSKSGRGISRQVIGLILATLILGALASGVWLSTRFDPLGAARAAYLRHEYLQALSAARNHLDRFPNDPGAALMAARCLSRLGKTDEAAALYRVVEWLDINDMHDQAIGLIQSNQPKAAADIYDRILRLRPEDVLALKRLSAVRMGLKQWRAVLLVADQLANIPSEQVSAQTMMAIAEHELKHYEQSVNAHLRVMDSDPGLRRMPLPKPLFWNNLAIDLMALGRDDEARSYLTRGLGDSHDASLMELVGLTYSRQGNMENAERCWREAESWDPKNADVCLDLGRLALSRRQWKEAIHYLKRAAEQSTDAVEPLYNLSQAHRMLGDMSEADRYKRLADQRRKAQPRAATGMGADVGEMAGADSAEHNAR